MTPWVLARPSQFRLPPPLALNSPEYAVDLTELKIMGIFAGSSRTSDQSELALFWAGNTPLYWNRIAAQLAAERGLTLTENAHLFALLNVAMADAAIACWDSKYRYVFWRPITAIRAGLTPADADPTWVPWLDFFPAGTPAHPEYPSGHSTVSGSAAFILAAAFWREYGVYRYLRCAFGHSFVFEFLGCGSGDRRCARFWRDSFSNLVRARKYAR
jgi:hypothetical protein